ncbi:condensation protein [Streptomyces sp. MST-110588]|uniref:condensation protein n=1 Tax=Streptomyces sp. MST-110588 TaxID=2833628 RepID=UPI001F5D49EC|nr:condensation protein [Streptomyces sp. MST-110588]
MTALQPAQQGPTGDGGGTVTGEGTPRAPVPGPAGGSGDGPGGDRVEETGAGPAAAVRRIPFPVVDEIARHCLQEEEPETVHIEVHLPGRLDHERLRAAFREALCRHPRILMRQAPVRWWRRRYEWELTGVPDTDPVSFPPPRPDALVRARERALTHCPPLETSPPVRLEVVEQPGPSGPAPEGAYADGGSVLMLTINHTALDGPATLRVLATAAELYGGAQHPPAPPPVRAPQAPASGAEPVPAAPSGGPWPVRPARIAADSRHPFEGNGMLVVELPVPARPPRTDGRAPYTVNDQLLVATCLMVARWNHLHDRPTAPVVVTMPVDDRPRGTDMPIGNGTRLVSVGFGPEERQDATLLTADPPDPDAVARLLRRTAARTRSLKSAPGSQLGLTGALLTAPVLPVGLRGALTRALRRAAAPWTSTTLLSNIGRIPYPLDFGEAGRPTAVWFSAPARMPRGLTVTTASVGGRIQLALRWSRTLLDDEAGVQLLALFEQSLAATAWTAPGNGNGSRNGNGNGTQEPGGFSGGAS